MLVTRAGAEIVGLALNAFVAIWLSRTVGADGLGYWAVTLVLIRFGGASHWGWISRPSELQRIAHREEPSGACMVDGGPAFGWFWPGDRGRSSPRSRSSASPVGDLSDSRPGGLDGPVSTCCLPCHRNGSWWPLGHIYAGLCQGSRMAGAIAGAVAAVLVVRGPEDMLAMSVVIIAPLAVAAGLTVHHDLRPDRQVGVRSRFPGGRGFVRIAGGRGPLPPGRPVGPHLRQHRPDLLVHRGHSGRGGSMKRPTS